MNTDAKFAMMLEQHKTFRILGIDDTPFDRQQSHPVPIAGIICAGTRFEGMLWTHVTRDGEDATEHLIQTIQDSKFYSQLHAVLFDGIAVAGFNMIDLPLFASRLGLPCLALMRKAPDLDGIYLALQRLGKDTAESRWATLQRAGQIYSHRAFCFQVQGLDPNLAGRFLEKVTDNGHVPEALRLAHLIGSAIASGVSSKRA